MSNKISTLFEVSWEVCNKVGGIYTVISTKAKSLMEKYDDVIMIGPDLAKEDEANKEFVEDKTLFEAWRMQAAKNGLKIRIGYWNIPPRPVVILVDFTSLFKDKNKIFAHFWEKYKLDSLRGEWDYIEPVMFGYAAGQVIESYYKYNMLQYESVIAHFHEWMTGSGILYLKENQAEIGTVFTTHATILGRTIAGNNLPLYSRLAEYNPQVLANKYNISAKYSLERLSAKHADSFTTVSSITANECKYLLKKEPDFITPNGFEDTMVPVQNEFNIKKQLTRNKLREVSEAVLGYEISDNPFYVLNSGRYEFKNKGIDVFIKSLNDLNKKNPDREIIAVIAVPAGIKGVNHVIKQRLNGEETGNKTSFFCTHELFYPEGDPVLNLLKELGMKNSREDKVKIIFVPVYLNGNDGIFDLKYYDFLLGFHLTAFPSYYEPWGYTPMESLAFHVPSVTTSLAGFGAWIKDKLDSENKGAFVIERTDENDDEVIDELKEIFADFSNLSPEEFMMSCIKALDLSKLALWKNLVSNYVEAYDFAINKADERKENIDEYIDYDVEGIKFEDLDSKQPNWKKVFIKPNLPENISFLEELSKNLWWTWNKKAEALFKYINIDLWEKVEYNPVTLLEKLDMRMLKKLSKDKIFLSNLQEVEKEFRAYMSAEKPQDTIAYFSMEFGLHDTLKIFSGGLGILAGDYMKEASDSNYNMIGVGLLYRFGYFKQKITLLGDQISTLTPQRFTHLPILPVKTKDGDRLKVSISLPGRILYAQVWKVHVGRNVLYLLDTDIEENSFDDRKITAQLYGGGLEMRLLQEILLGICGVRLLNELDIKPDLVHINEGHAAFTGIERVRNYIENEELSYCVAKEIVRSSSLFTTHTPVPAGHDEFPEEMIRAFLPNYNEKLQLSWNQFMSLGRINPMDKSSKFSMSILAANLSQEMNGVSEIHGEVSKKMFDKLYPGYFAQESHISYVTNGVHLPFWVGTKWGDLYKKALDERYFEKQLDKNMWNKIYKVENKNIWNLRTFYRKKMVDYLRERLKNEMIARNESPRIIFKMLEGLRDDVLTIGFARRFATYKRALLIFKNIDRLKEIVNNKEKPVQFVFAGKAHPNDKAGQDLIKRVIEISKSPDFIGKVFFVENYDITLAKYMVQGVDVWLNNPTRPLEASGTSGEKAIMNGVLNLSVLDGWWAEGYVEGAGWALKKERTYDNQEFQDSLDALTIYDLLEDEIQPAFYNRDKDNIPEIWVDMIKKNIAEIVPGFTMKRMIEDYDNKFYKPQIKRTKEISAENYKISKEIVNWKNKILEKWDNITILGAEYPDSNIRPLVLGEKFHVKLKLDLDGLDPEDIGAEILLGRKRQDQTEELLYVFNLKLNKLEGSIAVYHRDIPVTMSGVYDFTFRVYPKNKLLPHRMDFPKVKWI
jgi:phosphorylase/glycogen(starch) synthase